MRGSLRSRCATRERVGTMIGRFGCTCCVTIIGDMLCDYHWPQRIDGRLVGKENLPKGANMSMPYSHAYLIHAYKGPGKWDVSEQQIGAQKFRSHNPMWMLAVDGVREGDR